MCEKDFHLDEYCPTPDGNYEDCPKCYWCGEFDESGVWREYTCRIFVRIRDGKIYG